MGFGKTITTTDLLQITLIYLKLSNEIDWHWLTVLAPWAIIGIGGTALYTTGAILNAVKEDKTHGR
jgi:hypothetical protein